KCVKIPGRIPDSNRRHGPAVGSFTASDRPACGSEPASAMLRTHRCACLICPAIPIFDLPAHNTRTSVVTLDDEIGTIRTSAENARHANHTQRAYLHDNHSHWPGSSAGSLSRSRKAGGC